MTIEGSKGMYTTNAIESLNSGFRRLNRSRAIFPQRHGPHQGAVSGDLGADEKMDHARPELGAGLCGAGHHVPRQADPELAACRDRNRGRAFNRRQP